MGSSCSHSVDAWSHLATTEEVRDAVRSIEAWQKSQEQNKAGGAAAAAHYLPTNGPLLNRVGGIDVVKRVIEAWYRKLYADERLLVVLQGKNMVYLRAKQSAFMSWLFGPSNQPYTGKNLRIAHLRLIKQLNFSPEDFEKGMSYFEDAMKDFEAPETIVNEVMTKIRPFKDVIFTPSAKDADEEARWALEDHLKHQAEEQAAEQAAKQTAEQAAKQAVRQAVKQAAGQGTEPQMTGQPSLPAMGSAPSNGGSRPASARVPQCPFTGGRLPRPASSRPAEAVPAKITGALEGVGEQVLVPPAGMVEPKPSSKAASPPQLPPQQSRPTTASSPFGSSSANAAAAPRPVSAVSPQQASALPRSVSPSSAPAVKASDDDAAAADPHPSVARASQGFANGAPSPTGSLPVDADDACVADALEVEAAVAAAVVVPSAGEERPAGAAEAADQDAVTKADADAAAGDIVDAFLTEVFAEGAD